MSTKGKRPMRALTAADKIEAIQRVNDGESKASVARDIGVPESTLRGWCKNEDKLRYMSSRNSTPDKDKTLEEPYEKKARYSPTQPPTQIPVAIDSTNEQSPQSIECDSGLDLTNSDRKVNTSPLPEKPLELCNVDVAASKLGAELNKAKEDLNRYNAELMNSCLPNGMKTNTDLGSNLSMSAISPLTHLNPLSGLSGLSQGHMGMSFNDIATNLSLIAQLNPTLNALTSSMSTNAKTLRSIRSPKPSQIIPNNGALNLSERHKSGRVEQYPDKPRSKPQIPQPKDIPVDDALWYWFKTQQAMLDLTTRGSHLNSPLSQPIPPNRSPKDHGKIASPKPATPVSPMNHQMDRNTWLWQYYKQIGGALPLSEDNIRPASQVPKDNILYSHLIKDNNSYTSPIKDENVKRTPTPDKEKDNIMENNHAKARTVLDNLLYNNNVSPGKEEFCNSENEVDADAVVALEHGEKFLTWLETCRDPTVTQMRVHQLRSLLDNIRASVQQRQNHSQHRISRRK